MLDRLHVIATQVQRVRWLLWTLVGGACVTFVGGMFVAQTDSAWLLGSIIVLLWALLILTMAHSFRQPAPRVDPAAAWPARLRARIVRAYLWALVAMTIVLGAFVVVLSLRTVGLLLRDPA